jgi:Tfp pilus assembly protein PilO
MNQQSQFVLRRRNIIFLGICLGGLFLLLLISLIPLQAEHHALDQEITTLKNDLANQQHYQTGIKLVDEVLATLDQQTTPQVVSLSPLAQGDSDLIIKDIKSLARGTSLQLANIEPLLDNKNSWQNLTVHAELQGAFPDLRAFLLKLLALPYVKQIDRIEIHPSNPGLNFKLTYTLALG